jgi:DNA primase
VSRIPDDVIEQVRDAVDLVGLVGETVDLKRTGTDWRGACPFHGGTHRNFTVVPKKGLFYCYVCHEAGDAFTYLMKRFGMDYPTAVRDAARRAGIVIPEREERQAGPDPREPLYTAAAAAHDWFARRLMEAADAEPARAYLAERGIDLETTGQLRLGFAPRGAGFLEGMRGLGITDEVLLGAGLLLRREDGTSVPRFRGRLLFPIHDLRGRVVAFGGRLLGEGEPKYLNSPETGIFHKGATLYHLHEAKQAIRRDGRALVVEGYFDVLRLVLAGVENVVAPLGTALTDEQASLLRRYTSSIVLLYDSDEAGLRATFRAGDVLLRHGLEARVATLPPGEDPDTLVRTGGAAALEPVVRDAVDVVERKIQLLERKGYFADVARRRAALDKLLPTLRAAADPITRDLYLSRVAEVTGVSRETLVHEVAARADHPAPRQTAPARRAPVRPAGGDPMEWRLLRIIRFSPHWLARARAEIPPERFEDPDHRALYEALLGGLDPAAPPEAVPDRLRDAWLALRGSEEELATLDLDRAYVQLVDALDARPEFRAWEDLAERIRSAGPDERDGLIADQRRLREELERRLGAEWMRRHLHQRLSRASPRGRASTPRRSTDAP